MRLWKKGTLVRGRSGRAYAYTPRMGREKFTAIRMEAVLESAGDRSTTLARFVQTLSESERRHLREILGEEL